jgi:ABC-2 type transport system permease protein
MVVTRSSGGFVQDIHDAGLTFKFEMRKHLRRRRLLITIALAIFLPLLFLILPYVVNGDFAETAELFAYRNLGFASLLVVIAGAMFAGDSIASEFENKTALLLFPTPQRRSTIFTGKYIAAVLASFLVVGVYYLVTIIEMGFLYGFGQIPGEMLTSYLVVLVYTTSVVSVIYFFSSIFKRSITAMITGFFTFMMILPITDSILSALDVEPWWLVTYNGTLVTSVFSVVSSIGFGPGQNIPGAVSTSPDFTTGLIVMVVYSVVFYIAGLIIASRKQME